MAITALKGYTLWQIRSKTMDDEENDDPLIGLERPYGRLLIRASALQQLKRTDPESWRKLTKLSESLRENDSPAPQ